MPIYLHKFQKVYQQLMAPHLFLWFKSLTQPIQFLQQLAQDAVSTTRMTQTVSIKDQILELRWFTTMSSHLLQVLQQTKQELMELQEEHSFKWRLILPRPQLLQQQPLQHRKHLPQLLLQHQPLIQLSLARLTNQE